MSEAFLWWDLERKKKICNYIPRSSFFAIIRHLPFHWIWRRGIFNESFSKNRPVIRFIAVFGINFSAQWLMICPAKSDSIRTPFFRSRDGQFLPKISPHLSSLSFSISSGNLIKRVHRFMLTFHSITNKYYCFLLGK